MPSLEIKKCVIYTDILQTGCVALNKGEHPSFHSQYVLFSYVCMQLSIKPWYSLSLNTPLLEDPTFPIC